ncbi:MAG: hypothetical protein K2N12_02520 [Helicobacter sp.]|nr:hypothetical protein [Helicobacter sp.]
MRAFLCLFAVFVLVACSDKEDKITLFEKGIRALSYEAYDVAVHYFERSCHAGFAKSCEQAARLYQEGMGIKIDHERALDLLIEGCENDARTCLLVAQYDSPQLSKQQAQELYEEYTDKACRMGQVSACEELALQHSGRKATSYLRFACKNANAHCDGAKFYAFAGAFYFHQDERERAIPFLDKACKEKDKTSCHILGLALSEKDEFNSAFAHFERACALGKLESCKAMLADIYNIAPNVARQTRERLCNLGDSKECLQLAKELTNEKRGKSQSESFYRKAIDSCADQDECDQIKEEWQEFKRPTPQKQKGNSEQKPQIHESRI